MPSRSYKQRRKMAVLYRQGKISKKSWQKFKRVVPKRKRKRGRKQRR